MGRFNICAIKIEDSYNKTNEKQIQNEALSIAAKIILGCAAQRDSDRLAGAQVEWSDFDADSMLTTIDNLKTKLLG